MDSTTLDPDDPTLTSILSTCWCCPACIAAREQRKHARQQQKLQLLQLPSSEKNGGTPGRNELLILSRDGDGDLDERELVRENGHDVSRGKDGHDVSQRENGHEVSQRNDDSYPEESHSIDDGFDDGLESSEQPQPNLTGSGTDPLDHVVAVLRYHPQFLDKFLATHSNLLYGNGPVPYINRHYIAIMAASRNRCSYLVHAEKALFLMQGGDSTWLQGLDHVPRKLRNLSEINKLMAHRPWLLKPSHITALTKSQRREDNWSLSELTHALVLLAHFHALSSFVHGCGIKERDLDLLDSRVRSLSGSSSNSNHSPVDGSFFQNGISTGDGNIGIEELMEKIKQLSDEQPGEMSPEEITERFNKVENLTSELSATSKQRSTKEELLRYMDDPDFSYLEFNRHHTSTGDGHRVQTFLIQDFSWEDQGYSLASRLYMDFGSLLDDRFNAAQQLTYNMVGSNTEVDTTVFRRAVWNFIHCVYGIRHDDYDYSAVSQLVEKNLRAYIKLVACNPDTVTRADYDSMLTEDFLQSEKVHMMILTMEARMQSELLYSLRAVSKHMSDVTKRTH